MKKLIELGTTIVSGLTKGTKWGLAGIGVAGAEYAVNGKKGLVGGAVSDAYNDLYKIGAEAGTTGFFHGLYSVIKEVLDFFGIEGTWVNDWVDARLTKDNGAPSAFSDVKEHVADNATLYGVGAGATIAGVTAYKAAPLLKGGFSATATTVAPVMNSSAMFITKAARSLPGLGKFLGVAAMAGGGTAVLMSDDAQAAEGEPMAEPDDIGGAEIAGVGAAVAGTGALQSAFAPAAAKLGLRAIPGVSSVYAASETLYDTTRYALDGDFSKAAVRAVAGVGETVAGLGGIVTYGVLGTAWREAVNFGAETVLGKESSIGHAPLTEAFSFVADTFQPDTPSLEAQAYTRPAPAFTM